MKGGSFFNALRRAPAPVLLALAAAFGPAGAGAQEEGWTLDPYARLELSAISADSSDQDGELIINGDALTFRAQGGLEFGDGTTSFTIEADRIQVFRPGSGRRDSDRDRFTASVEHEVSDDVDVRLRARYYDDLVSAEYNDTDEKQIAGRVTYEPVKAHRFRLEGTWREREYDDAMGPGGGSSTGSGPRVDAEYRHRLGRYNYLTFDLRAEEIASDNDARRYSRQSGAVSYTQPITRNLRVRPAVEVRRTRFDGRLVDGDPRDDVQVIPEVELLWWPGDWRIEAEAKYINSSSNDPQRDREGYRLSLSVGHVF